jgi:hypothetical protein
MSVEESHGIQQTFVIMEHDATALSDVRFEIKTKGEEMITTMHNN